MNIVKIQSFYIYKSMYQIIYQNINEMQKHVGTDY